LFFEQLLQAQIPKAQKDTDDLIVFFVLLESTGVLAARKRHFGEIDPWSTSTT